MKGIAPAYAGFVVWQLVTADPGPDVMGVDWIPCRVEPGVTKATIVEAVEKEFRHFVSFSGYFANELWPLAGRDPLREHEGCIESPTKDFRLADLLLFKHDSHRVGAVGAWEVLPLEWRLHAYRTILPEELPGQLKKWMDYRTAVLKGSFRGHLEETLLYLCQMHVGERLLQAKAMVRRSLERAPSWVDRPEVMAARAAISILSVPEPPKPPQLELDALRDASLDERWHRLENQRINLEEATKAWNTAVRRGNWRIDVPQAIPSLEEWVRREAGPGIWFDDFTEWVKPLAEKGYGLYRDCEL